MRSLTILVKNTSELDFLIPLIDELNPSSHTVFFSSLFVESVIENNSFYYKHLIKNNVNIKSYINLIKFKTLKSLICSFKNIFINSNKKKSSYIIHKSINFLEQFIIKNFCEFNILEVVYPKIIFYPNRNDKKFLHKQILEDYIESNDNKIIFIPHGPHYNIKNVLFFPFNSKFKKNYNYWLSFSKDKVWEKYRKNLSCFSKVGYPMFDRKWINKIEKIEKKDEKYLGVITRQFYSVHQKINPNEMTMPYDEFFRFMKEVKKISENNKNIKLLIKPHPSTDLRELKKILIKLNIINYELNYDPIFIFERKIFASISVLSTSFLYLFLKSKPVFFYENEFTRLHLDKWPYLRKIYLNSFVADKIENMHKKYIDFLCMDEAEKKTKLEFIKKNLEKYYRSNPILRAKNKINILIKR